MEALEKFISEVFALFWDTTKAFFGIIPTVLKFSTWVILAVFILPCVWVAGNVYPWWVEWGEDF